MVVTVENGKRVRVSGRVATMILWLVARAEKLMAPEKMQVVFDCAGSSVSAEFKVRERVDLALLG